MGMPRNKAQLPTLEDLEDDRGSKDGEADVHMSTWVNRMQCSELVLGREVYVSHCGNPGGKLLISFLMKGRVPGKASQRRWHCSCREFRD